MDENSREEQVILASETPLEEQRSLLGVLAGDVNTVVTTAVSAVAGAYAIKKVLGGGADDGPKSGGDQDPGPSEAGPLA